MTDKNKVLSPADYAERWMRIIGLLQPYNKRVQLLANIISIIMIITTVSQVMTLVTSLNNLEIFINCFSVLPISLISVLKLYSLRANTDKWFTLVQTIRDVEHHHVEYQSDNEIDYVENLEKEYTQKNRIVTTGLVYVYICTLVVFIASPFIEYGLISSGEMDGRYPHILPIWVPFDVNTEVYGFMIALETIAAFYTVLVHVTFDIASIGMMIFISGQFSILRFSTQSIGGRGEAYSLSRVRDRRAHRMIVSCYQHHSVISSVSRILEEVLKPVMGLYINLATTCICVTAVRLSSNDLNRVQNFNLTQYMVANLTQLYFYCYFGDSVLQASTFQQGEGVFSAAWWTISPRVRKELLILGLGISQPLQFHAGWFHELNLPTYLSILQRAYSFYAVLSKNK